MNLLTKGINIKKVLILLFSTAFLSLFTCSYVFAQIPSQQDDLQIDPNALKNASPSDLMNFLQDFNQQKQKAGEDVHKTNDILPNADLSNRNIIVKDSTQKDNIKNSLSGPLSVYGRNIFQNSQILQLSELSTPPPDYPIGVGDHIVVSLWGGADFEQDYIVGRDGSIFPQGLGKITVQGLTFANAKSIIYDRFKKVIPQSTNISVTLGQPRSIVVQVSGNVANPGPMVVSAFTNALNIVALAGGVTQYGNMRKILISRNGNIIDSIDVYKYLSTGDFGKHLYLENNDFVIVPFYDKKVLASGQFKRPMYYQLKRGEGLADLLKFTGGFTPDAYASGGMIIRNIDEKQTIKTINLNAIGLLADGKKTDEPLYDGDIVVVNPINQGLSNKVIVKGEVAYPNVYEVRKGDRLFDVINRAGGVTPDSYLERAYVFKGAGDSTNLKADKIDVNLADLNKNAKSKYNIPIEANDVIEVFNKNQFSDRQMISIEGEVRNPGKYQKYGGMTLKDLLYFANGLKPSAEYGSIIVSSIVDIDSSQSGLKPTKTVEKIYSINQNLDLDSVTEKVKLKPYDQVFVRKNPRFHLQENVKIEGQVVYPGTYPKLNEDEHLSSFLSRSGGLRENSNANGAILYRMRDSSIAGSPSQNIPRTRYIKDSNGQVIDSVISSPSEPITIDLEKAINNPGSKFDLVLQNGDIIYVPEINPVVAVKGAVQNQLKIYFDKDHANLGYYIDQAGGFSVRPWRKRIYITYANGKSQKTRNFGFLHFYPKVKEGSVINVPVKPQGKGFPSAISQGFISTIPIALIYLITKL
ncbi:MAG: SLBB domain-containing protein [Bacteroidota bacterium]|nr:SLBB domain-containing protein [Bacteroidota bacterium]